MFSKKQNNKLLDMSKAEMISKSIVFIDKNTKAISNLKGQENKSIQFENRFSQLANPILLKTIIGKDGFQAPSSPMSQDFVFNEFVIQNNFFPPKFTIKHNTSDKKSSKTSDIAKAIIDLGNLSEIIEGVGINYELFYDNQEENINLKERVSSNKISSQFESVYIRLEKHIGSTKLNLTLSDGKVEGKKAIYILANFHNDISTTNTIESVIKNDFLSELEKIVEDIFEKDE